MKDFISIESCAAEELQELLSLSGELKKLYKSGGRDLCLSGKTLIMLFEKPSLRTRMSFHIAMTELGGSAIYVKPEDIGGIGKREPIKDMVRVLERYAHGIMARTFEHETVIELAEFSKVPVINALTDWSHPCQAMSDVLTIQEHCGRPDAVKIAYVGDGAFGISLNELLTCAREKIGVTVVVFNNRQWGAEKKNHVDFYSRRFQAVDLANPSWAAVAKAFGCDGVTVERLTDVGPALQDAVRAQSEGTCTVLEMMVTQELGDPFRRDALSKPVRHLEKYQAYT